MTRFEEIKILRDGGLTYQRIADIISLSKQRIWQILKEGEKVVVHDPENGLIDWNGVQKYIYL